MTMLCVRLKRKCVLKEPMVSIYRVRDRGSMCLQIIGKYHPDYVVT